MFHYKILNKISCHRCPSCVTLTCKAKFFYKKLGRTRLPDKFYWWQIAQSFSLGKFWVFARKAALCFRCVIYYCFMICCTLNSDARTWQLSIWTIYWSQSSLTISIHILVYVKLMSEYLCRTILGNSIERLESKMWY